MGSAITERSGGGRRSMWVILASATLCALPLSADALAAPGRLVVGYVGARTQGLYVVDTSSGERQRITARRPGWDSYPDYDPSWSPNGRRIAFASMSSSGTSHIVTVRPNGLDQQRLTSLNTCFGDVEPSWSPDSSRIVFRRDWCESARIHVIRKDGSGRTRITERNTFAPTWSPAGRWIAYESYDEQRRNQISVMRPNGNGQRRLTMSTGPGEVENVSPRFAPGGNKILYTRVRGKRAREGEVCKVRLQGGGRRCLTNATGLDGGASYSPAARRIVFVSRRDGNRNIYVMRADGTRERRLTSDVAADFDPEWSPNGRFIAFLRGRNGNVDLYVMRRDGSDLRRVTATRGDEQDPVWEPHT